MHHLKLAIHGARIRTQKFSPSPFTTFTNAKNEEDETSITESPRINILFFSSLLFPSLVLELFEWPKKEEGEMEAAGFG